MIHYRHHFGTDRTLELVRERLGQQISRRIVKRVLKGCQTCASVNSAVTFRWQKGTQQLKWYGSVWLLTSLMWMDDRISPMSIAAQGLRYGERWKMNQLRQSVHSWISILAEMGPPTTILADSGTDFRSNEMRQLMKAWDVELDLAALTERKEVDQLSAHTGLSSEWLHGERTVEEMTFWYNSTKGERPASPYEMLFAAKPRRPRIANRCQEILRKWPVTGP